MNHELLNGWLLENDCLNRFSFIQVFGHHSNPVWDTLFKGDSGFLNLKCLEPESEQSARGLSDTSGAFLQLCLATTATSLTETRLTNLDRKIPTQTCPFGAIHLSGIGWGKIFEHLILATKHGSLVIAVRAPELWPHWQTISPYPMLRWKSSCLALNPNIPTSNQANLGFPGFLWRKKWF